MKCRFAVLAVVGGALLMAGCDQQKQATAQAKKPLPSVVTHAVQSKDVSTSIEYVGRSEASQRVDIRARVTGVLLERKFDEGSHVKADAPLFVIDPAEYAANKSAAEADVARAEAAVVEASRNLARYDELLKRNTASVAQFDQAKAKDAEASANLKAAKAALEKAELNLSYTKIHTPIAGRSGRAKADVGNLIGPDTGVLVTVLKLDPVHVLFSIGEREYLNFMQARKRGDATEFTPRIKLANDGIYPHDGKIDVVDNEVDPATGTISVRVKFPNPDGLLVPGQFVNVLLTSSKAEKHAVVPQAAVQENQAGPFVLVVDKDSRVEARPIKTGQRIGTEIVALEGLTSGETIVVEGIQKVRPGAQVKAVAQAPSAVKQ